MGRNVNSYTLKFHDDSMILRVFGRNRLTISHQNDQIYSYQNDISYS